MLSPGTPAPDFTALNQDGKRITLSKLKGTKVVLFFYPADHTPTCTTEVCNLRDHFKILKKKGYKLFGISPDSAKSHRKFADKYHLPYDLLADTDRHIIKAYGVWGPKQLFGIHYDGVLRTTFVIDEAGIIVQVIDKVKSKDHAAQILGET